MLWWEAVSLLTLICSSEWSDSVLWPDGTYGLPKPVSGCPLAEGFQWEEGWRSQDTNGLNSNNVKSAEFHLDGIVDSEKVNRSFCVKTSKDYNSNRPLWPAGQYCIYKKRKCPKGLTSGGVYWDDENSNNENGYGGIVPGGYYKDNTWISFCCKTYGSKSEAVLLPSTSPFYLLAYNSAKCQMVKWAVASVEWIYYDTEHTQNGDKGKDAYPYEAGKEHPTIYYCYYRGCSVTLNEDSGAFQSPKNSDAQFCSWRIMVNTTQYIHLTIKYSSEQNEYGIDELYVYDGENATGVVLGVFNGSHSPPKEGIYSSSNRIFVVFKSDRNGSNTGFIASYCGVNTRAPCVMTTQRSLVTTSPLTTPKTFHTQDGMTSTKKPIVSTRGPTKRGGMKDQSGQSGEKGFDIVAVVVPIVSVLILIVLLVIGFVCWRRKRTKKDAPKIIFSGRSSNETPISVENPYYGRDVIIANTTEVYDEPITKQKGRNKNGQEHYMELIQKNRNSLAVHDSNLVIANVNGQCLSEGGELYTEPVAKHEVKNGEEYYMDLVKENQGSLYETAGAEAVLNPVYESSPCTSAHEEPPLYMELEKENPLYEDSADAVLNPIYDSSK